MESNASPRGCFRLFADGAARGNPGPAAYGFVLFDPDGTVVAEGGEAIGRATNNVAEYRGLLAGLGSARAHGVRALEVRLDSELVVRQLEGSYRVKNEGLKPLFAEARSLLAGFERVEVRHVRRKENTRADALANEALDRSEPLQGPAARGRESVG